METVRYLRALTRSWWLIALTIVAGGLGGFLVYHQTTPLYRTSVQMIVASGSPQADVVSAQALTSQQASALASIATTGPAIDDALTAAKVNGDDSLDVSAAASNSFLTISVSDADPKLAAQVAQVFPGTLPGSLKRLAGTNGTPYKLNTIGYSGVATSAYAPDWKRDIGLGLAAGLILGFALAVLRETLNRTVTDSGALRELTGLTVLGTVPRHSPKVLMPARSEPRSARAEAYRQVRTTLLSQAPQRPLVVAVTSASLGEGKTSVACNVAAIFSRAGNRVAIVDADLRRPRVGTFFELPTGPGLSQVLADTARLEDALVELDDGRLGVLAAGRIPANPAELLGSQTMVEVLRHLAASYDFVFVDTPPVLPVTDGLVVAPLADVVVVVAKLQGTTADRILRALEGLERVNAQIVGIVPNQASAGADRDYGYAYRYTPSRRRASEDGDVLPAPTDPAHLPAAGAEKHNVAALVQKYGDPDAELPTKPAEATDGELVESASAADRAVDMDEALTTRIPVIADSDADRDAELDVPIDADDSVFDQLEDDPLLPTDWEEASSRHDPRRRWGRRN